MLSPVLATMCLHNIGLTVAYNVSSFLHHTVLPRAGVTLLSRLLRSPSLLADGKRITQPADGQIGEVGKEKVLEEGWQGKSPQIF